MNKVDVFRMATEAYKTCNHIPNLKIPKEFIERFANLVASAEREEIIKLAEDLYYWDDSEKLIKAIQARGSHEKTN
tara:strand:+ start:600 stop:827 length:228 start_codon:yes stop_codon:yes gene_type:complete